MKSIITITCIILLFLLTHTLSSARGMLPPPPPFTGGNVGAWLGSGPMFDGQHPWGIDFPDDWDKGGGSDYGGGGSGYGGDGPNDGYSYEKPLGGDGAKQDTTKNYGCAERCQRPSLIGPCRDICNCRRSYHGIQDANHPEVITGVCQDGTPDIEKNACGWLGGFCWHYFW